MATAKKPALKKTAPAKKPAARPAPVAKPVSRPAAPAVKPAAKSIDKPIAKAPVKAAPAPKAEKPAKVKKPKQVRDSFTMPKPEYTVLEDLKLRAARLASPAKKSELLRAGVKALAGMSDADFLNAVKAVPTIKTGRPSAKS